MINKISVFNPYMLKMTGGEMNAFEETIHILIALSDTDPHAGQQEMMDRMGEHIHFEDVEQVQNFMDRYYDFYNSIVAYAESIIDVQNQERYEVKFRVWSLALLDTLDESVRGLEVSDAIERFVAALWERYDIGFDVPTEMVEQKWIDALGHPEYAEMVMRLIVLSQELKHDDVMDHSMIEKALSDLLTFAVLLNEERKEHYRQSSDPASIANQATNNPTYKVGRNDLCPCGSGKKYKKCCLNKTKAVSVQAQNPEPDMPLPQLSRKEVDTFYSTWARFMAFVGNIFCAMSDRRYQSIYGKDRDGKWELKAAGIQDGYYLELREFLFGNLHALVADYLLEKKVSRHSTDILNAISLHHVKEKFYAMEHFPNGNAIFYAPEKDTCYYVYKGYDDLSRLLPPANEMFETMLIEYRGRIIGDGVYGLYSIQTGANLQRMLTDAYAISRKALHFTLPQIDPSTDIYQLKITIKGSKPPVWRRILLASTTSLAWLHVIIQSLFEWTDSHLHQFETARGRFVDKKTMEEFLDWREPEQDERSATIASVLHAPKDRITYVYDFGDNWVHTIVLEKIVPHSDTMHYPACIKCRGGAFAEDSGGVYWAQEAEDTDDEGVRIPCDLEQINQQLIAQCSSSNI